MTDAAQDPKPYAPKEVEQKWRNHWFSNKTYKWDPKMSREEGFVIDTPPPTISGHLHMGHIYSWCWRR